MTKNVKILGTTYNGVDTLNAKEVDSEGVVKFVETSDANAVAEDIKRDKTAYVNGQKVVGTSDAIVPEGDYSLTIQGSSETIDIANYSTLSYEILDTTGNLIQDNYSYCWANSNFDPLNGAGVYDKGQNVTENYSGKYYKFYNNLQTITGAYVFDNSEDISDNYNNQTLKYRNHVLSSLDSGVYQVDNSSQSNLIYSGSLASGSVYSYSKGQLEAVDYPGYTGAYHVTYHGYGDASFDLLDDGHYAVVEHQESALDSNATYYFDANGDHKITPAAGTNRADLITNNKALKTIVDYQASNRYQYKTIATYPTTDGTYTYTAATDTFAPGGGGGPSIPGLYSYKDGTLTEVTSSWLTNYGNGNYADLGSHITYYLYDSGGPAAMPLTDNHMWYITGSGNMPQQLSDGTWNCYNQNDPTKLTDGHYKIDGKIYNAVATYPQADGNYAYTQSTDSFTSAPPAPSGTLEETFSTSEKSVDVTNYATIHLTLTDIDSNPVTDSNQKFYYMGGSGLNRAASGVYTVDGEGTYTQQSLNTTALYEFSGVDFDPVFNMLAKGVYTVFDDNGQYTTENIQEGQPGVYAYNGTEFGSNGVLESLDDGYYRVNNGEITDYIDPGVYVLAEDGPQSLNYGTFYINGTTATEMSSGYYSIGSAGLEPTLVINSLIAFYDQGQVTDLTNMDVDTEQTITLVTGKQFKVTRIQ